MAAKKSGLGRGLDALFPEKAVNTKQNEKPLQDNAAADFKKEKEESNDGVKLVKVSKVEPNRNQPRKKFDEDSLLELSESIKQYGVLQPLLVSDKKDYYEIIAGERRWRAAKMAGIKEIPVIVREFTSRETVEISLIENIQREDLNPVEEALAYKRLMEEFHLKQEEIAARVSKNRTTITNSMRLLKLHEKIQNMVAEGVISSGHARALLSLEDQNMQLEIADRIVKENLSVREVERLVKALGKPKKEKVKEKEPDAVTLAYQNLEEKMKSIMGTKVSINRKDKNKGRIEIEYYSSAELERIVELIESIRQY